MRPDILNFGLKEAVEYLRGHQTCISYNSAKRALILKGSALERQLMLVAVVTIGRKESLADEWQALIDTAKASPENVDLPKFLQRFSSWVENAPSDEFPEHEIKDDHTTIIPNAEKLAYALNGQSLNRISGIAGLPGQSPQAH